MKPTLTKEEYVKKVYELYTREGTYIEGLSGKISPAIINNGYNLYLAICDFTMLVPVVQNDTFFCDAPYKLVPNVKKLPFKVFNPQKGYSNYKPVIIYNTESYIVESILPNGKGLYSRIEDLFKMDLIHLVGIYEIVIDCTNEGHKYKNNQVCYVVEAKQL